MKINRNGLLIKYNVLSWNEQFIISLAEIAYANKEEHSFHHGGWEYTIIPRQHGYYEVRRLGKYMLEVAKVKQSS
jgi:hypothetical protein